MNKREKILLLAALVVILIPIIYFKITTPFVNKCKSQSLEIKKDKEIIKKMKDEISQKDNLTKEFSLLTKKIRAKLPLEREENQFLAEIGKVSQDTDVHIITMNPLLSKNLGVFKELSVEIDMEANLGNLVRFLYQMRRSSVVLVANKLALEPKSKRSALLKGNLIISTIFLKRK